MKAIEFIVCGFEYESVENADLNFLLYILLNKTPDKGNIFITTF